MAPALPLRRAMRTNTRRWKILVVDDYPDAADMTAHLLRLEGYEVAAAYHGLQAVEVARDFNPDLVLLDINMPIMDGYAAAKTLRREQPSGKNLVLIAHTANSTPSDVQSAIEAGFDRHVSKPVRGEALFSLIEAYLPQSTAHVARPSDAPKESPQGHGDSDRGRRPSTDKPSHADDGEGLPT